MDACYTLAPGFSYKEDTQYRESIFPNTHLPIDLRVSLSAPRLTASAKPAALESTEDSPIVFIRISLYHTH